MITFNADTNDNNNNCDDVTDNENMNILMTEDLFS